MEEFTCSYCGKTFKSKKSLSAHISGCKNYYLYRDGNLDKYYEKFNKMKQTYKNKQEKRNIDKKEQLNTWIAEQHLCENCGNIMTEYYGSGRFCSQKCARVFSTKQNKKQIAKKAGNTIKHNTIDRYYKNPKYCIICEGIIPYEYKRRLTCSTECSDILRKEISIKIGRKAGLISAQHQSIRSKNEIAFCNLCENYFGKENVLHNERMFNGWDADIIILPYNLAILWNGPWHYRKITKSHNLEQVKNRDKLKIKEIKKCNYIPYIIKDNGSYNEDKVLKEFDILLSYLYTNKSNNF